MDARGTPTPAVAGQRSVWKLIGRFQKAMGESKFDPPDTGGR